MSRYGVDPFHYIPASSLHGAGFTAANSYGSALIFSSQAQGFRQYKALHGGSPDLRVTTLGSSYQIAIMFSDDEIVLRQNLLNELPSDYDWILFVDWITNLYVVREGSSGSVEYRGE